MPCVGKIIGGMWYVDRDDVEGRLPDGRLWRKLHVRLSGTTGPQRVAALINLRGWWEKWHGSDGAYDSEIAFGAFEEEVISAFGLAGVGWELKGCDSWNGGRDDGALLVAAENAEKKGGRKKGIFGADLLEVARFLDGLWPGYWEFLPEDMNKWDNLPKDTKEWAAYGRGGGEELFDRLGSRDDMAQWTEVRRLAVWKRFCDRVCQKRDGRYFICPNPRLTPQWVLEWCEERMGAIPEEKTPSENLLWALEAEQKRRTVLSARKRRLVFAGVGLFLLGLVGAASWCAVRSSQEEKAFRVLQERLSESAELEKLMKLETDLKSDGGGLFLRKERKSLCLEVMNRVDEALDAQTKAAEQKRKRGDYEEAARLCDRIGACLEARGEDSSDWTKKGKTFRERGKKLDDNLKRAKEFLDGQNYTRAKDELDELERMVEKGDESRRQRMKEMRKRVHWEPQLLKKWEAIQTQAASDKTLDDWRAAQRSLNELAEVRASAPMSVEFPILDDIEDIREVLEARLGAWEKANKLYEAARVRWAGAATPAAKARVRDEVRAKLESCLDMLNGIYDENGRQPCGGPEMGELYEKVNQKLGLVQQN